MNSILLVLILFAGVGILFSICWLAGHLLGLDTYEERNSDYGILRSDDITGSEPDKREFEKDSSIQFIYE